MLYLIIIAIISAHLSLYFGGCLHSGQSVYCVKCTFQTTANLLCDCVLGPVFKLTHVNVHVFQEERLQHANLRPSGLRPLFLSTLLVFRWLLQCPIRTSSTVTATSRALTNLLRSYRTATRRNSSLPIRYIVNS